MFMDKVPEKFACVIPIRDASTRFPGKPFAEINGKKMIDWVWENAKKASLLDSVTIAAYDQPIVDHCEKNGYDYIYVDPKVLNGSEAVADAARHSNAKYFFELQGDQPIVGPDVIDNFLREARDRIVTNPKIDIVQPFSPADTEQTNSEDVVKVAISNSNKMLLVTRHPIESGFRTLGLYLWKRDVLLNFSDMEVTEYEKSETCHLIRFFLNDLYVQGVLIDDPDWIEVDREHHIKEVEEVMKKRGIK